jgi:hypothetical protein
MWAVRKESRRLSWFLVPALLAGVLLVFWTGLGRDHTASPVVPLHDWDIPRLVAFLNEEGMDVVLCPNAFLTTTNKGWEELNALVKQPEGIEQWQGVLYCEHVQSVEATRLSRTQPWGDCCLIVGPCLFFCDPQLLARVRAALTGTRRQTALLSNRQRPRTAPVGIGSDRGQSATRDFFLPARGFFV